MWPEIEIAKKENRHELILHGEEISRRIAEKGVDPSIYQLTGLNYLDIHDTILTSVASDIKNLHKLKNLVLHSNRLETIDGHISDLTNLKILDLSGNCLENVDAIDFDRLTQLISVNVSNNRLKCFPKLTKNSKLTVIDLSRNQLKSFPDVCAKQLSNLSELKLSRNAIDSIPIEICDLIQLKVFDLSSNQIRVVPAELSDCAKLKDVNLKSNPIEDRKLSKLIEQNRTTKQILDYAKQNCPRSEQISNDKTIGMKESIATLSDSDSETHPSKYSINVTLSKSDEDLKIVVTDEVRTIREHLVSCIVDGVVFDATTFKKFIQLQNKLHETICGRRTFCTIATHDLAKLSGGNLTYTTLPPNQLEIKPLNRTISMTGVELFTKLQIEANNLRKEKKRNTYSGIHKYLALIEGRPFYPCLLNANGRVISFPPITNSDITKIEIQTTAILMEVTGSTSQKICKNVLDTLLKEMVYLFDKNLNVRQVKSVDQEGNVKVAYPSKTDLIFEGNVDIKINRIS